MIRDYEKNDFEGLVNLLKVSLQMSGWSEYVPQGFSDFKDRTREDFLIGKDLELIKDDKSEPFLKIAAEKDLLYGAVIGQTLSSFALLVPQSINRFEELGWLDGKSFYQRHIAALPDASDKTAVIRLFRELKKNAAKKGNERLIVGVPLLNTRGQELMKILRYEPSFEEKEGTQKMEYPLVYFSQKLN